MRCSVRWGWCTPRSIRRQPGKASIPPTADDRSFPPSRHPGRSAGRKASVMGGVAGHAGLFATAEDMAIFANALLQGGRPSCVPKPWPLFTRREPAPAGTSRALGWDTPSSPSQSGKYFSAAFLRPSGLHRNFAVDRSRTPALRDLAHQPHLAGLQQQAIKTVRPAFHDAVDRSTGDKRFEATGKSHPGALSRLATEQTNPRFGRPRSEVFARNCRVINAEDAKVAPR